MPGSCRRASASSWSWSRASSSAGAMRKSSCRGCVGDDGGPMILEVDDLQIHYSTRAGTVRAVDGASFAVPEGRIVGLVGESGCGKTTAVRAIMGVLAENGR